MEKSQLFSVVVVVYVLFLLPIFDGGLMVSAETTKDGSEQWGYVEVRPKAHMFWWLYQSPYKGSSKPWPIILWLQGGPGSSGVGSGNFQEIGPLDTYLKPRNSTWLKTADLLFVDSPVGAGYSYVENASLLVKTDEEAADDLTKLLIELFNTNESLQKSPLYIVGESYGGKHAVALGLSALRAIEAGKLKLMLGGVVLGDSWISAQDYVFSWGPLLKDVSRLDDNGLAMANRLACQIKHQLMGHKFGDALDSWGELESVIYNHSYKVDFYNFMLDAAMDPLAAASTLEQTSSMKQYSTYLSSTDGNLTRLMNNEIKKKLKIIPQNLTWADSSDPVFYQAANAFMKPAIEEVDMLLSKGVNVTIYNGQLDLICSTKGTEAWVRKLKWGGLKAFLQLPRTPIYCGDDDRATKGFTKSHKNLHFYWVLGSGHFVPAEQPCVALSMIANITRSYT